MKFIHSLVYFELYFMSYRKYGRGVHCTLYTVRRYVEDFRCSVSNINVFLVCKNVKENVVHGKIVLLDYFIPKEMANNEWRMRKMNAVNLTCARAYIYTHTQYNNAIT